MALLRTRFSERGRTGWLLAAVLAGVVGVAVTLLRGDVSAAILIALVCAALVAAVLWGRLGRDGDDGDGGGPRDRDQPRP